MTVEARNPQAYVLVMWKLDRLRKLELSLTDGEDRAAQQNNEYNSQPNLNKRLFKKREY
jgi:hypothetical protein